MASKFLSSAISIVLGVALLVIGGPLAASGVGLIVGGLFSAASIALRPDDPDNETTSPTYGFSQFRNPVKGDAPIPIVYSANGHKTAPVWVQAFVTPRGLGDEELRVAARGQRLSGLLAVAEGPLVAIEDIRINDEPVYEKVEDAELGTGNGSKKKWTIDSKRIDLRSVQVSVDGTLIGWKTTIKSDAVATGDGVTRTFSWQLPDDIAEEVPLKFYFVNPAVIGPHLADFEVPAVQVQLAERNRALIHRDAPIAATKRMWVRYGAYVSPGITIRKKGNGTVEVVFDTAPTNGAKVTVSYRKKNIPGLEVQTRLGGAHQLPIYGFQQIRNSFAKSTTLTYRTDFSKETQGDVDDIIVNLASSESGMGRYSDTGDRRGARVQFAIEVRRQVASSNPNTFNSWYRLDDPRGAQQGANKSASEFQVVGNSGAKLYWSFSVRNILEKLDDKRNGSRHSTAWRDFKRGQYEVRVRRTNPVGADNSDNWVDELIFDSITEVRDEALNHPGTALIGFHALATERLSGGAPQITCVVKGIRTVQNVLDDGTLRWSDNADNQSNRVWAAVDLITNARYGAGEHYTLDDIDKESALEVASWLDEEVAVRNGSNDTEVRSRLDIVIDRRRPPLDHAKDILLPGRVWLVQRGLKWVFVKDDAVDLDDVPIVYDELPSTGFFGTTAGATARKSLSFARESVSTVPTEVQVTYLDETQEWQSRQVWATSKTKITEPRRIRRVTAWGMTRETEVHRYAGWLRLQLRTQGVSLGLSVTPNAIDYGAGDVIKVVSNRIGVSGYWRIFEMKFSTETFFVEIDARQYIPANYAVDLPAQTILTDNLSRLLAPPVPQVTAPSAGAPTTAPGSETSRGARTPASSRARTTNPIRVRSRRLS